MSSTEQNFAAGEADTGAKPIDSITKTQELVPIKSADTENEPKLSVGVKTESGTAWPELEAKHDELRDLILGRFRSADLAPFVMFVDRYGRREVFPAIGNSNLEKLARVVREMPEKDRRELSALIEPKVRGMINLLCAEFTPAAENRAKAQDLFPKPRKIKRKGIKSSRNSALLLPEPEPQTHHTVVKPT